jgi:hypothetical protein
MIQPLSQEDENARLDLYKQGMCDKEIAMTLGKTRQLITNWRTRRKLKKNPTPDRIRKIKMNNEPKEPTESICWNCKNAVPVRDKDGNQLYGCLWSIKKEPMFNDWTNYKETQYRTRAQLKGIYKNVNIKNYAIFECKSFIEG